MNKNGRNQYIIYKTQECQEKAIKLVKKKF